MSSGAAIECGGGWERRWRAGDAPWDLGRAPPCLEALIAGLPVAGLRVLVPGAGRGHDAAAWARGGHRVTAVDIAPTAVELGRSLHAAPTLEVHWVVGDVFALPASMESAFDVVWEQTCFCAIEPEQRLAYAEAMRRVLRPGGMLHALLWNHGKEGGPPWSITPDVAREYLGAVFEIEEIRTVPDWTRARWSEFLVRARRP